MTSTHDRLDRIELELATLRRSHARWRATAMAAIALASVGVLTGLAADPITKLIRASRIELVDDNGKVSVALSASEQGGQIDIWAKGGANVGRLAASESGGDLSLWNTAGKPVTGVYASSGGGRIEVSRGDGELAGYLEATADGSDLVLHRAGSERPAARLGVNKDGSEARLAKADTNTFMMFGVTPKGSGVSIVGQNDAEVAYFGSDQNRAGMLRLGNAAGSTMLEAGVGDHGGELLARNTTGQGGALIGNGDNGGFMDMRNGDGKAVASLAVQPNGGGVASVCYASGQVAALMDQGKDESGTVQVFAGANRMAALGGSKTGGLLNLFNMKGKAVFVAGSASDGTGGILSVRSGDGTQVVRASAEPAPEVAVYSNDGQQKRVISAPTPGTAATAPTTPAP